ncbi:MAG: putative peptidoglycan endopeptidase LytE precursor [Bacteroidetes bacterium ADurb.Bin408]|nr:MAG: putative peptidoglycan endopeptidase LytE precursor [Bacteroidetes bacterium ADurb.Bin408]
MLAQENTVIRVFVSDKIETINNKEFYLHKVEKGQTLYSIAVAYDRPIQVIVQENNIVNNLISTGQILRIPVEYAVNEVADTSKINRNDKIWHEVKKGETLFGISKKYNISIQELEKLNPELKNGLKAGQKLVVSTNAIDSKRKTLIEPENITTQADTSNNFFIHIVKNKETLFSISNLYVVPVKDIIALNPEAEKGIKPKMNLKIPTTVNFAFEIKADTAPKVTHRDTVIQVIRNVNCPPNPSKKVLQVGLLIPLYLEEVADINTDFSSHAYQVSRKAVRPFTYIGFYQGLMLALDSLKLKGVSLNLHVFDITEDIQKARNLIGKPDLKKMDLIIGPFFKEPFNVVANFAKDNKIKIVNPVISDNSSFPAYQGLFNTSPNAEIQIEQLVYYLYKKHNDKNILIVNNNSANEQNILGIIKKYWNSIVGNDTNFFKYTEVLYNRDGLTGIINNLKGGKTNIVLCLSNNEAFVSNFIRKLSEIQEEEKLMLFGLPSWQKFNNIELAYLDKLKYHYFTTNYINYRNANTIDFIEKFRLKYEIEPDNYAFLGYDIGLFFINSLYDYGPNFTECINNIPAGFLFSPLQFRVNPFQGSYDNITINFLRYNNFILEEAP